MFTEMEGASHLQKSDIIVHWLLGGEIWVYDDGVRGEDLFPRLCAAQVMFSSSNIQNRCRISMEKQQ